MLTPVSDWSRQSSSFLTPQQLEVLRNMLVDERNRIIADYHRDFAAAQSAHEEGAEDLEELAAIYRDREFLFARSEVDRQKLLLIEEALRRMDAGTYGLCQWTGKPISFARLQFIPWARYGIDVQEKIETGELRELRE